MSNTLHLHYIYITFTLHLHYIYITFTLHLHYIFVHIVASLKSKLEKTTFSLTLCQIQQAKGRTADAWCTLARCYAIAGHINQHTQQYEGGKTEDWRLYARMFHDIFYDIFSESSWPSQSTDAPKWQRQWQIHTHKYSHTQIHKFKVLERPIMCYIS